MTPAASGLLSVVRGGGRLGRRRFESPPRQRSRQGLLNLLRGRDSRISFEAGTPESPSRRRFWFLFEAETRDHPTSDHPEAPDQRPLKLARIARGRISRTRVAKSRKSPSSARICVPRDAYSATPTKRDKPFLGDQIEMHKTPVQIALLRPTTTSLVKKRPSETRKPRTRAIS